MAKVNLSALAFVAVVVVAALLAEGPTAVKALTCDIMQLMPCAGAFLSNDVKPSPQCCDKLKIQQPCFCQYLKDPKYKDYANSPGAKRVTSACNVSVHC